LKVEHQILKLENNILDMEKNIIIEIVDLKKKLIK
jgi:hypothetical protein